LVKLRDRKGIILPAASQHRDSLKVFKLNAPAKTIAVKPFDAYALIKYKKTGKNGEAGIYHGLHHSLVAIWPDLFKTDDKWRPALIIFPTVREAQEWLNRKSTLQENEFTANRTIYL